MQEIGLCSCTRYLPSQKAPFFPLKTPKPADELYRRYLSCLFLHFSDWMTPKFPEWNVWRKKTEREKKNGAVFSDDKALSEEINGTRRRDYHPIANRAEKHHDKRRRRRLEDDSKFCTASALLSLYHAATVLLLLLLPEWLVNQLMQDPSTWSE